MSENSNKTGSEHSETPNHSEERRFPAKKPPLPDGVAVDPLRDKLYDKAPPSADLL